VKKRTISVLLALCITLALIPAIRFGSRAGNGYTADDSKQVYGYAQLKAALEDPAVDYIQLLSYATVVNDLITVPSGPANYAISLPTGDVKHLTLMGGETTFTLSGSIAGLIDVPASTTLNISGEGKITLNAFMNAASNAVIYNRGGTVNISGNVILEGNCVTETYGRAIIQQNGGSLSINGGTFIGTNGGSSGSTAAVVVEAGTLNVLKGSFVVNCVPGTVGQGIDIQSGVSATVTTGFFSDNSPALFAGKTVDGSIATTQTESVLIIPPKTTPPVTSAVYRSYSGTLVEVYTPMGGGFGGASQLYGAMVGVPIAPLKLTIFGGRPPYHFSATGLPPGITVNSATGTVSGTPTAVHGEGTAEVTVTDSHPDGGRTREVELSLMPVISTAGAPINATLVLADGTQEPCDSSNSRLSGTNWSYDQGSGVLTLNGFAGKEIIFGQAIIGGIPYTGGYTIHLVGNNTLTDPNGTGISMSNGNSLTTTGASGASLSISKTGGTDTFYGISVNQYGSGVGGHVTFQSGTVSITASGRESTSYGVITNRDGGNVVVEGSASLNISLSGIGSQYGIASYNGGGIHLGGSGIVSIYAASSGYNSYALAAGYDAVFPLYNTNQVALYGSMEAFYGEGGISYDPNYYNISPNTAQNKVFTYAVSGATVETPVITVDQPVHHIPAQSNSYPLEITATVGDGGSLSYQWFKGSYADMRDASALSGGFGPVYNAPAGGRGTTYFYCQVTNRRTILGSQKGAIAYSPVIQLTVDLAGTPTITSTSPTQTVYKNDSVTLTVAASASGGSGTLSYQWYGNSGAIPGATNASYSPSTAATGAYSYHCRVTNTDGVDSKYENSSGISVFVQTRPPVITGQPTAPAAGTVHRGDSVTLTVTVAEPIDGGVLSYQWCTSSGGDIAGATSASFSPPTDSVGAVYYYCRIASTTGEGFYGESSAISSSVMVAVSPDLPVITSQPAASTTVSYGAALTLTVAAATPTDGGTLSYQWYNENSGSIISGATEASFVVPTSLAGITTYYCMITNNVDGFLSHQKSASAQVTVSDPVVAQVPTIKTQPTGATTPYGIPVTLSVVAEVSDGGTLSYQWYVGGGAIGGATSAMYSPPVNVPGIFHYSCVVTNTLGPSEKNKTSKYATVVVNSQTPSITVQPTDKSVVVGGAAVLTITVAAPADGGTLSYQWHYNDSGAPIPGATSDTYSAPTAAVEYTGYYCMVTNTCNGQVSSVKSNSIEVTVNEPGAGVTVSGVVRSYNPKNAVTLELWQGAEVKYITTIVAEATGSGQQTQSFSFADVVDGTYDLVVSKNVHLTTTISGVVVDGSNVDLTEHANAAIKVITLLVGDTDGNGSINVTDFNYVLNDFGKTDGAVSGKTTDFTGEGSVNVTDFNLILNNFGKTPPKLAY